MLIEGIYGFTEPEHQWLSNMHVFSNPIVDVHGVKYYSSETYYVAHKTDRVSVRKIVACMDPKQAKVYGRKLERLDEFSASYWDSVKVDIMRDALYQKFANNPDLLDKLMETGDLYIEETNTWYDEFWGVCEGKGQNVLGNLIMNLREFMRNVDATV